MAKGPFDEEFTAEEEALLKNDNSVPPAEDGGEGTVEASVAEATPAPAADAAPAAAAPGTEPPAGDQPPAPTQADADADEKALAEFLEKHKDKSPEELARLALQQSKRANRAEQTNRQIKDQVSALAERTRTAAARHAELAKAAPNLREEFKKRLSEDPDAAAEMLFDAQINRELTEAEVEARAARIDEAIVFADTHIPNFSQQWPGMHTLANHIGYSDEEINQIDDPRSLIVLSLANHTARLMMGGVMDRFGNIVAVPQMETQPIDPRLAPPNPQRTLGGGARSTRGNATIEQQLADIAAMSDDELSAFEAANPGAIDNLLRQAA